MRDVSHKTETLRTAVALAELHSEDSFPELIRRAEADKGDPRPISRIAGILAAKNTASAIPLCHTIPILHADCYHQVDEHVILLEFTCTTRAQTGVEIESLHGVSTAAVTLYDVLKPHTDSLEIRSIRLKSKTGGKSHHRKPPANPPAVHILHIGGSDGVAPIAEATRAAGIEPEVRAVAPGELQDEIDAQGAGVCFVVGELNEPQKWHERVAELIELPTDGLVHAVRQHGLLRRPGAMFAALKAGWRGDLLVVTAPHDADSAEELCTALIPYIFSMRPHADDS